VVGNPLLKQGEFLIVKKKGDVKNGILE